MNGWIDTTCLLCMHSCNQFKHIGIIFLPITFVLPLDVNSYQMTFRKRGYWELRGSARLLSVENLVGGGGGYGPVVKQTTR